MASFTEQATLQVKDQATAQIKKINAALKSLQKTAAALKSKTITINVNDKGLSKAATTAATLSRTLRNINRAGITLSVNTSGITAAQRQLASLRAQAGRPITVTTRATAGAGGGGGVGGIGPRRPRTPVQGFTRGFVSGLGTGMSDLIVSYGAVAAAGHLAAQALRSVAENAAKRDRTTLQSAVQASAAQRQIFDEAAKAPGGIAPGAQLKLSDDQRKRLWTSLLGDVQGEGATPEEREKSRARGAIVVSKYLEETVLPRLFAQDPNKSKEETLVELRKFVQAANLASADLLKGGKITVDGQRAMNAIMRARAADPELPMHLIKSTMANLKTSAFSMSENALTAVLINAGERGQRAANEAFRAQLGVGGGVDIKVLNESLEKLGLVTGFQRLPGKKGKPGKIIPGTGTPIGKELLETDPLMYMQTFVKPKLEAMYKKERDARVAAAKKQKYETPEARTAAIKEAGELTHPELKAAISRAFPSMAATAKQGVFDFISGFDKMMQTLEQTQTGMQQNVSEAVKNAWTTQAENVGTAWSNMVATAGESLAKTFNLAPILEGLAQKMSESPALTATVAGIGVGIVTVVGAGMLTAVAAPFASLSAAGVALQQAAAALSTAAGVPTPGGGPPGPAQKKPGLFSRIGTGLVTAATFLATRAPAILAASIPAAIVIDAATTPAEQQKARREGLANQEALREAARQLQSLQTERAILEGAKESEGTRRALTMLAEKEAALQTKIDTLITKITGKPPEPIETKPPEEPPKVEPAPIKVEPKTEMPTPEEIGRIIREATAAALEAAKKAPPPEPPKPEVKEPPKPIVPKEPPPKPITPTPAEMQAVPKLAALIPQLQQTSQSITLSVSGLTQAGSTFATVFSTGAQQIGASGQAVIAAIQAGAPGAGAVLGNAAVAAIRAGVSNLNINVNANVTQTNKGSDTGTRTPD